MPWVSPNQFGGHPGEPNPESFNRDADYISAHKQWSTAHAEGKRYHDPDFGKIVTHTKKEAAAQAKPLREEHRQVQRKRTQLQRLVKRPARAKYRQPKVRFYRSGKRNPFG